MAEKDITRISAGHSSVSIVGIGQLMEEVAGTHTGKPDEEVGAFMLARLTKDNYIPISGCADYCKAFLREFGKFVGRPYVDDAPKGLDIKVLGAGCNQCRTLTQVDMEALTVLKFPAGVDHVPDIKDIARYGIMGSPALLINSKAVAVGSVPTRARLQKWGSSRINIESNEGWFPLPQGEGYGQCW